MKKYEKTLRLLLITIFYLLVLVECYWTRCSRAISTSVVDCSGRNFDKIVQIARLNAPESEFCPSTIGGHVRLLNLSWNGFKSMNFSSFSSLRHPEFLEILDISHNKLLFISPGAFKALSRLKILLLNGNELHALDHLSFADLTSLEELNLDSNPLSSFPDRTFTSLTKLRRLSIASNQLSCDCQIADLLRFINKDEHVQVSNRTVCIFPYSLRGTQIVYLNVKILKRSCGKGDFNPAVFNLEPPSRSLIIYPGGEKNITCKISKADKVHMEWLKNNVPVIDSPRLLISRHNDSHFLYLELYINPIVWKDEGDWTCYVEHGKSVLRNTVRITPILVNTLQCVQEWQADEKGEIIWPVSKQGLVAIKCPNGPVNAKAYRQCKHGKWDPADTSHCTYASQLIKHLLTLLQHGYTSSYIDELLRIRKQPAEMSAYETRLVGWLIGNATGLSNQQTVTALNFALQSEFARTELNGEQMRQHLQNLLLGDQIIQENYIAVCQHLLLTKNYDITGIQAVKNGFLAVHNGFEFLCNEQQHVELLPATGGASVRIPHLMINRFPTLTILRILWLLNTNIFKTKHTLDGKWVVISEVYGVAIKHVPLKSRKSSEVFEEVGKMPVYQLQKFMTAVEENSKFYGFFLSYRIKETFDQVYYLYGRILNMNSVLLQIQLGVWDDGEGWKLANETDCLVQRVGPNNVLFTCSQIFFTKNFNENIKYFAAMQNVFYQELLVSLILQTKAFSSVN
ncbi:unnamed protein product [Thelazia callipaeda]|uniref:Adhesion G protein-coupled receptor A3 n=1 Tax=Thelazia callipaeda TaxID=103827 RepID=A0A0N5CM68_THECL|nr:unnamed protein product [Thelazia callipaeda]